MSWTLILLSGALCSSAWADFSDDFFPNVVPEPTPKPTVTPGATPASTQSTAIKSTVAPTPASVLQPVGGTQTSGNFFSDVKHDTNAPVNIEHADSFAGSRDKGIFALKGNVVITQQDMRMTSAIVDAYINKKTNKMDKIVARRNVYVQKPVAPGSTEKIEAWADEMEYGAISGKMILRNNAKVKRGKDCDLMGKTLNYDLTTGSVSGDSVRGTCLPATMQGKKP